MGKDNLGNFRDKDNYFMVRCPKCKRENYAPNVVYGVCTWCGYDGNKEQLLNSEEK